MKKTDKVTNPAKLRVDFRFLCELVVCGVLGKEGLQVSTQSFLQNMEQFSASEPLYSI